MTSQSNSTNVEKSYQCLAMLGVCIETLRGLEGPHSAEVNQIIGNVGVTLKAVKERYSDIHDALELAQRREKAAE